MELFLEAQKESKRSVWPLFGGGPDYDKVAELYTKAANKYKANKQWSDAANAYLLASEANIKANHIYQSITSYINAASVLENIDYLDAIDAYRKCITMYIDNGKFIDAAKTYKLIAELYQNNESFHLAIESYSSAIELYNGENTPISANICMDKMAQCAIHTSQYAKAAKIYDELVNKSNTNSFMTNDLYLMIILCHLANNDMISAEPYIDNFTNNDHQFKFIRKIMESITNFDITQFRNTVTNYDKCFRLNHVKVSLLNNIMGNVDLSQNNLL
jgi:alpha-soluble NSF attachment protein